MRNAFLLGAILFATGCGGVSVSGVGDGGADGSVEPAPDGSPTPVDGGAVDSASTGVVEGVYFTACLTKLAAGRIDRVLRFYTMVKYTPIAPDGRGQLKLDFTALKLGDGNGPPPSVSKAGTVGQTFSLVGSVTSTGVYSTSFDTITVPGAANPISGRDIVMEQTSLPGRFAPGRFCSQLVGHVVTPVDITLEGDANNCIYIPVKDGEATPVITENDLYGGCPLN